MISGVQMHPENTDHESIHYRESLMTDFARTISKMDRATLERVRAEYVSFMSISDPDDTFLEIIDGNFALREISELPD